VSLPEYIIEPPDIVTIDAVNPLLPKPPYKLRLLDVLNISVLGTPEALPISGLFTIEADGQVDLGPEYGSVKLLGLTTDEAEQAIFQHLSKRLREVEVSVSLRQTAGTQQIAGEHLVQPDGKVNLGAHGRVRVVGMTIAEATAAIESHLAADYVDPKISLDIYAFNSKVFYIVTQGAGLGDTVTSFPVKGNETVLDAIAEIGGLSSVSSYKIWIARPGQNQYGGDQLLPIDLLAITQRGAPATNYQLLPGDRLYIAENHLVAVDNRLAKLIAPVERVVGIVTLGARLPYIFQQGGGFGGTFVPF
jgi:polysaccharide export outer membrane protein